MYLMCKIDLYKAKMCPLPIDSVVIGFIILYLSLSFFLSFFPELIFSSQI